MYVCAWPEIFFHNLEVWMVGDCFDDLVAIYFAFWLYWERMLHNWDAHGRWPRLSAHTLRMTSCQRPRFSNRCRVSIILVNWLSSTVWQWMKWCLLWTSIFLWTRIHSMGLLWNITNSMARPRLRNSTIAIILPTALLITLWSHVASPSCRVVL